ncbi:hypothetical protein CPB86DRAFT_154113 [Serendipita vermifera]|nr:hypothetical protein CPB86DRAFT_154113 [Serendipita vermifera]
MDPSQSPLQHRVPLINHKSNINGFRISLSRPRVTELHFETPIVTAHQPRYAQGPALDIANSTVTRLSNIPAGFNQREKDRDWDEFTSATRPFRTGMTTSSQYSIATSKPCNQTHADAPQPLDRRPTLFAKNSTQQRKAAELKNVLGSIHSGRLDSRAKVLPSHKYKPETDGNPRAIPPSPVVSLEQAKASSKVELDLLLDSDVCVEGGYMRGSVVINIRSSKKGVPIYLGDGKVRVIGFEAIPYQDQRHIFYHCGAPLNNISPFIRQVYASPADGEGFYPGKEGEYLLPFAMRLPPRQKNLPVAKGVYSSRTNGSSVQYIAMVSIMLKHPRTQAKSIAHFYRAIEVWPLLDPSSVLAPAPSPLFATASKSLSLGGSGTIELTASLHRATWIAGQRCYISLSVANNSAKRKVRTLTLSLVRSETVFKPHADAATVSSTSHISNESHPCQSSTTKRVVARSTLEAGESSSMKHATAKGWWTGVNPGTSLEFSHYFLIPPFSITIPRSRLIEVGYVVDVAIGTGPLASDTAVQIPIQIINHISIDPPPIVDLPERFQNISLEHPAILSNPHVNKPHHGTPLPQSSLNDNGTYRGEPGMPTVGRLEVRNPSSPQSVIDKISSVHESWIKPQEEPKILDRAMQESNDGRVEPNPILRPTTEPLDYHLSKDCLDTDILKLDFSDQERINDTRLQDDGQPDDDGIYLVMQAVNPSRFPDGSFNKNEFFLTVRGQNSDFTQVEDSPSSNSTDVYSDRVDGFLLPLNSESREGDPNLCGLPGRTLYSEPQGTSTTVLKVLGDDQERELSIAPKDRVKIFDSTDSCRSSNQFFSVPVINEKTSILSKVDPRVGSPQVGREGSTHKRLDSGLGSSPLIYVPTTVSDLMRRDIDIHSLDRTPPEGNKFVKPTRATTTDAMIRDWSLRAFPETLAPKASHNPINFQTSIKARIAMFEQKHTEVSNTSRRTVDKVRPVKTSKSMNGSGYQSSD